MSNKPFDDISTLPIGVFDSGVGGLTVVREIIRQLPQESILYFGDTLRCPYGSRPLEEIKSFARQIAAWLIRQGVKLIVVACNSATAAALETIQQESSVPVIGVVAPGARAAVQATQTRRIGVIGTKATINSDIYCRAIRALDEKITVFSVATPRFVDMVEQGLHDDYDSIEHGATGSSSAYLRPTYLDIARDYLSSFKSLDVDTLVLGCTHFPLLVSLISQVMGPDVRIISSAEETAHDVAHILAYRGQLAADTVKPKHRFVTTASRMDEFIKIGSAILARPLSDPTQISLTELEMSYGDMRQI